MIRERVKKLEMKLEAAPLGPRDGMMVLIIREGGGREILFPKLGLISEGKIEQSVPFMFREILKARIQSNREVVAEPDETEN